MASFDVLAARKLGWEQKKERGGRGRGDKETLADKPLEFEKPVRQRTGFVIGSALVLIIDMCPSKLWFCQNTHNVLRFRASSFWNLKTSDCYSFPGRRRTWPEPSVKASVKLTRTFPEFILRTNFTWRPPSGRLSMFKNWSILSLFSFSDILRLSCPNFEVFRIDTSFVFVTRETPKLICVSDFFPLACLANAYLLELT